MPVLLALVLLPIQFGMWWNAQQTVSVAAEQGVSAAQADGPVSAEAGVAEIVNNTATVEGVQVDVSTTNDTVTVRVTAEVAWSVFGSHTVTSTATGPLERFVPEPER